MILNEQSDFSNYGTSNAKNHIIFGVAYASFLHVRVAREKSQWRCLKICTVLKTYFLFAFLFVSDTLK